MSRLSLFALFVLRFWIVVDAVTVSFAIEITQEIRSPDGYPRQQLLVNGTSPGPPLVMNDCDNVEFLVTNNLDTATAIHFHGISQLGTPYSDGVPGLSQKPIPPGGKFLYRWVASDYGTYWYHGHLQSQVADGLFGAILIQPKASEPRPFDKITGDPAAVAAMMTAEANPTIVMVSDWTHLTLSDFFAATQRANLNVPCTNSILVNGKGQVTCPPLATLEQLLPSAEAAAFNGSSLFPSGCVPFVEITQGNYPHNLSALPADTMLGCTATSTPSESFVVGPGQEWVSFNFIGAVSVHSPLISIDEHSMWIYAVDGRYIEPQLVQGVEITQGQRYSAMVLLNQTPGTYMMRFPNVGGNQLISAQATVSYNGTTGQPTNSTAYFNYAGAPVNPNMKVFNTSTMVPFPNIPPPREVDATHSFYLQHNNASWSWTMSGYESYPQNYSADYPLLWNPYSQNTQDPNLVFSTTNGTWVDIVWVSAINNGTPSNPPHSMHKHGGKFYLIGGGEGEWIWNTVAEAAAEIPQNFNFETPAYRDGVNTISTHNGPTWIVIRYQVVNPGAWLLHCHIQIHLAGGMAMAVLDGVDAWPQVPYLYGPDSNGNGLPC